MYGRTAAQRRLFAFNSGEDLKRTLQTGGNSKHHADARYNFGVTTDNALKRTANEWGDLVWIANDFKQTWEFAARTLEEEILSYSNQIQDATGTISTDEASSDDFLAKLRSKSEGWMCSRFRHSLYPSGGVCTEHTDYGFATLQMTNSPGLQAFIDGRWQQVDTPDDCFLLFAGDMLELLTNGAVPALLHRVNLDAPPPPHPQRRSGNRSSLQIMRQCNIFFLQPDRTSSVAPLPGLLRDDGTDHEAVVYGDWHLRKSTLAFHRY